MSEILKVENVSKSFEGIMPVKNVSFSVNRQTITLITGENGAGKTTLFNLVTGLEKPTKGHVYFNGTSLTGKSALDIARQGVVRLYQQPRLFKNLSVWENLVSAAHQKSGNNFLGLIFNNKAVRSEERNLKQKAIDLLRKFGLEDLSDQNAGELSYGQQKLISFCMIAMNGTKLALLDEPFSGLNPQTIDRLSDMIVRMRDDEMTFIIIEHNLNRGFAIADGHIEMKDGRVNAINNIGDK